ncbi:MAG TPA: serine O-acetyltransferase [Niastella sp.]|nr:serine O-acetyltransferase [Niastella sp.]
MNEQDFIQQLLTNKRRRVEYFLNKQEADYFIQDMFQFLFVAQASESDLEKVTKRYEQLKNVFAALLSELVHEKEVITNHVEAFFGALPQLYKALIEDAEAILKSDPAARSLSEVIVAYPGFYATVVYRISHCIWNLGITILPRLFCEYAHSKTGIDIHPGATIGKAFAIDHGTGVVIGETTIIGNHVKIYQGVTLGALNVSKDNACIKRHPTIEDNVILYSGATILGGETVIGRGSIIGGNVWLTYSVPRNSVVYHKSEIKVKDKDPFPEPLNFVI